MDDDAAPSAPGLAAADDVPTNPHANAVATIGDIIDRRFGRRGALKTLLGIAAAGLAPAAPRPARAAAPAFDFEEIAHGVDGPHHVAPGYAADILIRWGDPLGAAAPAFDPHAQSAAAQAVQFGYNNDFVGYIPLDPEAGQVERGLLCVNHEYTSEKVMFPGRAAGAGMTADLVAIEMAAHGGSIVEVVKRGGKWPYIRDSEFNRRITTGTPMALSGPAAGHARLRTSADPSGRHVIGTLNNCAGGITPWGTYLMAEENFNGYFGGELNADHPEAGNHARHGVPGGWYAWGRFDPRFDVGQEPREANRFGWIVEVDPFDPRSMPAKRTALGRFKHEGAEPVVNKDGRVVVYMGDDQRFEYIYKFVSRHAHDPDDRRANKDLLDTGTLYVARFDSDGTVAWLPLVHGRDPLSAANGFASQAEVLIEARRAADLLGATPIETDSSGDDRAIVNTQQIAQTFTAGLSGLLTRVDLQIGHVAGFAGGDLTFDVRPFDTITGKPVEDDSLAFGTTTIALADVFVGKPTTFADSVSVDVSSFNLLVTAGDLYALMLRPQTGRPIVGYPTITWAVAGMTAAGTSSATASP